MCANPTDSSQAATAADDGVCLELFHGAIVDGNQDCWTALHEIYASRVQRWCRIARGGLQVDVDELAAMSWERFWCAFTSERFARAEGIGPILSYLKTCVWSTVADQGRRQTWQLSLDAHINQHDERPETLGDRLPDRELSPADAVNDAESVDELQKIIYGCVKTRAEGEIAYLTLEVGLKSREIRDHRPDLFPTIASVYTTTRNIYDRLLRSPALRRWLEERAR